MCVVLMKLFLLMYYFRNENLNLIQLFRNSGSQSEVSIFFVYQTDCLMNGDIRNGYNLTDVSNWFYFGTKYMNLIHPNESIKLLMQH
uniref:Uncharacterized protein n=1 Tax=Lepeophtheirus salmonis TaxID=72036 RepID=A0A0K2V532_LEPSM